MLMRVPKPPSPLPIQALSPTIYEALVRCPARAVWAATPFEKRPVLPTHPSALLGTAFHAVMAAAHRGEFESQEAAPAMARRVFDQVVVGHYEKAHALLRAKFRSPQHLPYFNLLRERAVARARPIVSARASAGPAASNAGSEQHRKRAEMKLSSRDGVIAGRPDFLDADAGEVVDYKSGAAAKSGALSEGEERQLRLYAYLAFENGIEVAQLVVVRADGARDTQPVTRAGAEDEAKRGRALLTVLNEAGNAGRSFEEIATPSPASCQGCPCIPFCEPFWAAATTDWAEAGAHAEGTLTRIDESTQHGVSLLALIIEVSRGTVPRGTATLEQLPEVWLTAGDGIAPELGTVIRVVDARLSETTGPTVVRADKATTAVWSVVG